MAEGHTSLPGRLNNFGNTFLRHFEHAGDLDDISQAIRNHQRVVCHTPDGHARLPCWLNNLDIGFFRRFGHAGDLDNISQSIQNYQRAVQLTPDRHPNIPARHSNLGTAFFRHLKRTGASMTSHKSKTDNMLSDPPHMDMLACHPYSIILETHFWSETQTISLRQFEIINLPSIQRDMLICQSASTVSETHSSIDSNTLEIWTISNAIQIQQRAVQITPALFCQPCSTISQPHFSVVSNARTNRSEFLSKAVKNYPSSELVQQPFLLGSLTKQSEGRCIVWNQINQLRSPLDDLRTHDQSPAERFSAVSDELEGAAPRTELRVTTYQPIAIAFRVRYSTREVIKVVLPCCLLSFPPYGLPCGLPQDSTKSPAKKRRGWRV